MVAMLLERRAVVVGHDLYERALCGQPVVEQPPGDRRVGTPLVLLEQLADGGDVVRRELLEPDELGVAALLERAVLVEDIGDAAAHTGGKVPSGPPDHDDDAAGHVLAAVVADALDDGRRARVPYGKPLADEPAEERLARRGAVEDRVAGNHVLLRPECRALRRAEREYTAREPLADVVVRLADQRELDPRREPRAERLAGRTAEREAHGPRQPGRAMLLRHRVREEPTDRAVAVGNRKVALVRSEGLDQPPVESVGQRGRLRLDATPRPGFCRLRER